MTALEQPDFFETAAEVPVQSKALERDQFAVCRARSAPTAPNGGCGGHHESGLLIGGHPVLRWICCAACPARSEVASSGEDAANQERGAAD